MTSLRWAAVSAASLLSAAALTLPASEAHAQAPRGNAAGDADQDQDKKPRRGGGERRGGGGGEGRPEGRPAMKPQGGPSPFQKSPDRSAEPRNAPQKEKRFGGPGPGNNPGNQGGQDNTSPRRTFEKRPAGNAPSMQPKPTQVPPTQTQQQPTPRPPMPPPVNAQGNPPAGNQPGRPERNAQPPRDFNRPASNAPARGDTPASRFNKSIDNRAIDRAGGGYARPGPGGQPTLWQRPGAKPLNADQSRQRFDDLRKARKEKVENGRTIIQEPDKRVIVRQNNRMVIQHDETERLRRVAPNARFERGKNGGTVSVIDRPGNVRIYSETDERGQLIRRYRRGPDGRDVIIIDNRPRKRDNFGRNLAIGAGIGLGVAAGAAILNSMVDVPEPRVRIPRDRYIVDYERASEEDVYDALSAPPVEDFRDRYTLNEIRATSALRDRMRRVDLDDITFEFGSWEVDPSQYRKLDRVARAMKRVIDRNPNEVFLIEGYTDAVGSEEDNLSLSDRRAESVAEVLTEEYRIPFENLTTQGYGEQYLKVPTQSAERLNRRVAVRRITPLMSSVDVPPRRRAEAVQSPPPPPPDDDARYEHYETGPDVGGQDDQDGPSQYDDGRDDRRGRD